MSDGTCGVWLSFANNCVHDYRYARYIGTKRDHNNGEEVETSWCVRKIEEQGAVLVGKLNMHELGMGKFR